VALTPAGEFAAGKRRLAAQRRRFPTSKERGESRRGAAAHQVLRGSRAAVADQPAGGRRRSARQEVSLDRIDWKSGASIRGAELSGAGESGDDGRAPHPRGEDGRDAGERLELQRGGRELRRRLLSRAAAARTGIGGALPQDGLEASARVDASNAPLQGGSRYVLRFSKNELPPVNAFWSLTLLDDEGAWSTTCSTLRRARRSPEEGRRRRRDRLRTGPPPGTQETNWLPAPNGTSNSCCVSIGPRKRRSTEPGSPGGKTRRLSKRCRHLQKRAGRGGG